MSSETYRVFQANYNCWCLLITGFITNKSRLNPPYQCSLPFAQHVVQRHLYPVRLDRYLEPRSYLLVKNLVIRELFIQVSS